MKKCKVLILTTLLLLSAAKTYGNYTTYLNFQHFGGYSMAGIGTRMRSGFNAIDLSISACPFDPPKSLHTYHIRGLYLFYPRQFGVYVGTGAGILHDPEAVRTNIKTFEAVIGMQLGSKFFIQVDGIVPLKKGEQVTKDNFKKYLKKSRIWPGLTVGLGF